MTFILDDKLRQDTLPLAESDLFLTLLINDQRFPWVIIVPKVCDVAEIYDLDHPVQLALYTFSTKLGQKMMNYFQGDKLNTAAIGNIVKQLHIHHVVRYESDSAWPGSVWGSGAPARYPEKEASKLVLTLQDNLLPAV